MSGRLLLCVETALRSNPLRRIFLYTSLRSNHRHSKPRRALSLKPVRPNRQFRASIANRRTNLMADHQAPTKTDQTLQEPEGTDKGIAGSEKLSPPPPPPPEKPLPGDCCGSGCVRCVWDVYYEELEEYNKLYSSDSGPNPKPSS